MAVILDSGAFGAWTRQVPIDLDQYISFCKKHSDVDYYVNLDVIPGHPTEQHKHTQDLIEQAAAQGWKNYLKMIKHLPIEKVVPVYHYQESVKWLEKILDVEAPYIGIGFGRAKATRQRASWLKQVRGRLTGADGKCIRAVHGFAVTGFDLMKCFPWHSVDSATWVQVGGFGSIFVPSCTGGQFDYTAEPWKICVSDSSPSRGDFNYHVMDCSPAIRKHITKYLQSCEIPYGVSEELDIPSDYTLQKGTERWAVKGKRIIRVREKGVVSDDQYRKLANAIFYERVNAALPINRIYLAGQGLNFMHREPEVEMRVKNRLFTYIDVRGESNNFYRVFRWHCENTEKETMPCK